jgi:hypothetical protein
VSSSVSSSESARTEGGPTGSGGGNYACNDIRSSLFCYVHQIFQGARSGLHVEGVQGARSGLHVEGVVQGARSGLLVEGVVDYTSAALLGAPVDARPVSSQ